MLKKKTRNVLPALALVLLLAPTLSQAAVSSHSPADVHTSLLDKLAHWLDFTAAEAKAKKPRASSPQGTIKPKHGCGIDPQGVPYCSPD